MQFDIILEKSVPWESLVHGVVTEIPLAGPSLHTLLGGLGLLALAPLAVAGAPADATAGAAAAVAAAPGAGAAPPPAVAHPLVATAPRPVRQLQAGGGERRRPH